MTTLLQIDSSGKGSMSVTRPLTKYFASVWQSKNKNSEVIVRDLLKSNIPLVTPEFVGAIYTPADKLQESQKEAMKFSDDLLKELEKADVYVFGIPMYNFSVPGVFKLYIDQIVRAGKTFSYENGIPKGLLKNKTLVVITSSGGDYTTDYMRALNFLEPYIKAIFGFIGVASIKFITVAGKEPEVVAAGSEAAKRQIDEIVDSLSLVAK